METRKPETIRISRRVAAAEVDTVLRLPFDVPPDVERLEVAMRGVDPSSSVRVGLQDPRRLRGMWSGGRTTASVARENATPGFERGPVSPGRWALVVLPTRVGAAGCVVEAEVTFVMKRRRWLKGDLHLHTFHSDGHDSPEAVIDRCRELGLDFIALTDHDTCVPNSYVPLREGFTVLPGVELSTHKGHANCIGVDHPYVNALFSTDAEVQEALRQARRAGSFISLNHPFDWDPGCAWRWTWDVEYDALEAVNGPYRPTNQRAMDWWQKQLCAGRKLPVVGGSDSHNCFELTLAGMPTTWVYAEENGREAIVAALKRGNAFISIYPRGPGFSMQGRVPGETVRAAAGERLSFPFELTTPKGSQIRVITSAGEAMRATADRDGFACDFTLAPAANDFVRVEAWEYQEEYDRLMLTCLTNPVYVEVQG
jgi:hypothetical protein